MPRRRSPRRSKTRGSDEREEARFLVVDLTAWGWILLIWGAVLALAGLALLAGQEWARWSTIVVVSLNLFTQLGFVGKSDYPCGR